MKRRPAMSPRSSASPPRPESQRCPGPLARCVSLLRCLSLRRPESLSGTVSRSLSLSLLVLPFAAPTTFAQQSPGATSGEQSSVESSAQGAGQQPAGDVAGERPSGVENARHVVGQPAGPPLRGEALEAETKRVALLLRCPVCQGLSVAESPSSMAINMREQVRELVAAGYTEEQVLRYFERSYGEFVRLEPPLRGVNWIVWLAPIGGLLAGGLIVFRALRGPRALAEKPDAAPAAVAPAAAGQAAASGLADDPELAPYLARVRELAYGRPGEARPDEPKA